MSISGQKTSAVTANAADVNEFPTLGRSRVESAGVVVDIGARSHPGHVRVNNEDSFLVNTLERRMTTLRTNLPSRYIAENYSEIAYGMIVADGMGGAAAGEVASRTAIAALVDLVIETPDWIMRLDDLKAKIVLKRTEERIRKLVGILDEATFQDADLDGMGTTLTLAVSHGSDLLIAHVGDSRAYLLTAAKLLRLTKDQTMAQLLADIGVIRADQVATHHQRHILTDCITPAAGSKIAIELRHLRLADGDKVLLCTDGLTDMIPDDEINKILSEDRASSDSCQALVDAALTAGGRDNITVIQANYRLPATDQS